MPFIGISVKLTEFLSWKTFYISNMLVFVLNWDLIQQTYTFIWKIYEDAPYFYLLSTF